MILQFANLSSCQCNTNSLNNILNNYKPTLLKDIKIQDLCLDHSNQSIPLDSGHGVYLFYDNQNLIYVGSCSSQLFLHRIPSHCDHRNLSGFSQNTFLQKLVNSQQYPNMANLQQAQAYSFANVAVILINFSQNEVQKHNIRKFENLLRQILNPRLNGGCSFKCYNNLSTKNVSVVIRKTKFIK